MRKKSMKILLLCFIGILATVFVACSSDDFGYEKTDDGYAVIKYSGNAKELTVPSNHSGKKVTVIAEEAFNDCTGVKKITLPDTVVKVEKRAFRYCRGLVEIELPDSITAIEEGAFFACESLVSVTLPGNVTVVEKSLLRYCSALTEVTLPAGITAIGRRAFYDCPSLASIRFGGTIAQWGRIDKGDEWDGKTPIYTVHCSDGDLLK